MQRPIQYKLTRLHLLGLLAPFILTMPHISQAETFTGTIAIDGQELSIGAGGINAAIDGETLSVGSNGMSAVIQGSGQTTTETRAVSTFDQIRLETPADLEFTAGKAPGVVLSGDDNLLPLVQTQVQNGVLTIATHGSFQSRQPIQIRATGPGLSDLRITASSDVQLHNIRSRQLNIEVSGSGDVSADGKSQVLRASLTGSGDLNLENLHTQQADVRISGSGDVEVTATDQLSVNISGAGDVTYYGNPETVNKQISGAGDVMPAD